VHRLDRETSGVLLFARTREACELVQERWSEARKTYLAVVEGRPLPDAGVIDEPLREDRALNVHVGRGPDAKPARTRYRTLELAAGRALLEVELDTGRRHQIRAHLAWLGHPVVGDDRYGTPAPRLGLHALRLELDHPRSRAALVLEAPAPRGFGS
jgi:23S rRNA pseudouridine1911/1915/1917 synthase